MFLLHPIMVKKSVYFFSFFQHCIFWLTFSDFPHDSSSILFISSLEFLLLAFPYSIFPLSLSPLFFGVLFLVISQESSRFIIFRVLYTQKEISPSNPYVLNNFSSVFIISFGILDSDRKLGFVSLNIDITHTI